MKKQLIEKVLLPIKKAGYNAYFVGGCVRDYLSGIKPHDYDIVIGAMANDQIYNYVSDYMEGAITREQFWILAKFKYPTHQINFCTNEALKCLEYRGAEEVL